MKDKEWKEKTAKYILSYRSAAGIRSSRPPMERKAPSPEDIKREKHRMYEANRRRNHRQELNAKKREQYHSDPEKRMRRIQRSREYYQNHIEEMREKNRKREAERRRLKGAELNARKREMFQNDPEKRIRSNQRKREYYQEHKEEICTRKKMRMFEKTLSEVMES